MILITEDQLKSLHTKHRTPYTLDYVDHKVVLQNGCRRCYEQVCVCEPRWLLQVWFHCSWCDKTTWSPRAVYIQDLKPSIEDFFSEME